MPTLVLLLRDCPAPWVWRRAFLFAAGIRKATGKNILQVAFAVKPFT